MVLLLLSETDVEAEVEQVLEVEQTLEFNLESAELSIAEKKNILNDAGLWPSEIGRDLRVELGTSTLQNLKIEFTDTSVSKGGTFVKGEKRQLTSDWSLKPIKMVKRPLEHGCSIRPNPNLCSVFVVGCLERKQTHLSVQ